MKKTILAGAIAAMMLASAATSAVTCAQDNNAKVVTVTRRSLCSRAYKEPRYKRQTSDGQR